MGPRASEGDELKILLVRGKIEAEGTDEVVAVSLRGEQGARLPTDGVAEDGGQTFEFTG